MSAAAKAATLPRLRKPRSLSPWAKEGKTPWFATPVGFLHLARLVTPGASACAMVLLCAASEQEANEADVKQKTLAVEVDLDVDTVQAAISELEEIGAIRKRARLECKKRGESRFVYELLVGAWGALKPLPEPEAAEPEAAEPEAAEPEAAEPEAPIAVPQVKIARNESKPLPIPAAAAASLRTYRCQNRSDFPIALDAKLTNGCLSIDIFVENKVVVGRPPGENTDLSRFAALRDMLNRALAPHLGFVPEHDLAAIGTALNGCPVDQLARRLHQRRAMFTGGKGTWGGALLIAQDCAKAFAAASAAPPASPAAAPERAAPSAEDEAAYTAHCDALFERWWGDRDEDERSRLNASAKREIVARFAAAKYWPPAQLAETVRQSIRAEALKTIAPTFADFLRGGRAKAKGASA